MRLDDTAKALKEHGPMTAHALSDAMGYEWDRIRRSETNNALRRLEQCGRVRRVGLTWNRAVIWEAVRCARS